MLKQIVVGALVLSVGVAIGIALLDNSAASQAIATPSVINALPVDAQQAENTPAVNAQSSVGDAWSTTGTIQELTSVGMSVLLADDSLIFVELGSPEYWQAQGVALNVGDEVQVDGFFNGTDYHAREVINPMGAILALRDETGQPLWSGSNRNAQGENGGQGQAQVPADQWVTLEGMVSAMTNNGVLLQTDDGQTLNISFGRADFWQSQAVSFQTGDAIRLQGFWQGTQFQVGQVTKVATDERILLRDPNGRPLWAGPGRGQGNGNQAQHSVTPTASAGQ